MNKIILIDIDNILVNFHLIMVKKQKEKYNKTYYDFVDKIEWDSWTKFLTKEQFFTLVKEIHNEQYLYKPFPSAKKFLQELKNDGWYIILASHRHKECWRATKLFLKRNGLFHNELHISFDKTVLFNKVNFIVDDSPETLKKAVQAKIPCTSLKYDWNEHLNVPLFDSLDKMLNYIKTGIFQK